MKIEYNDRWLRIICYPLLGFIIRHFGEYESIGSLMKKPIYYGDLAWNTLLVAVSWEANRRLIRYLDREYSWIHQRFQRFVIQLSSSFLITIPLVAGMIYLWNEVIIMRPNNFNTAYMLVYDFPLTVVFTLMVHMIYTGWYFKQYFEQTIGELQQRVAQLETSIAGVQTPGELNRPSGFRELLIVSQGTSSVPVHTNTISYIFKQNEICFLRTFDGKEYTSNSSLEQLEILLDPSTFFRLNRQILAHVSSISKFKADLSGKLRIDLSPPFDEEIFVSKKKAATFREWVGQCV